MTLPAHNPDLRGIPEGCIRRARRFNAEVVGSALPVPPDLLLRRAMLQDDILWPAPPVNWPELYSSSVPQSAGHSEGPGSEAAEIHVWAVPLRFASEDLGPLAATLSAPERERAERFHFARHRNRFIAGRGALRAIVAQYLQTEPNALEFVYGLQGKPALAQPFAGSGLQFNLAHSDELALLAVTRAGPIGVDVERVRPLKDAEDLVERFFSKRENDLFRTLAPDQKPAAFFNLWTRKEAWLKATGEGIAYSLKRVEVSFLPGEPAKLLALPEAGTVGAPWSLRELSPHRAFAAALAVAAPELRLRCWRWEPAPACRFEHA